jgi:uncharacterized membrane protein
MIDSIKNWLQNRYQIIIHSIAFFPVLMGLLFLAISIGMISLDYSAFGKELKSTYEFLSIKDAETARSILSAIAGGIISLTVFSFSMVMIVLNQAASSLSNRVLDNLIGNRQQQYILGIYIGTIVYAFFILTAIRDVDNSLRIPSISTYFAILLTIFDIFLFIYFLHYITQSVKFDVIVSRIYQETKDAILENNTDEKNQKEFKLQDSKVEIKAIKSGVFEGFNESKIRDFCEELELKIESIHLKGTFILNGSPLIYVSKPITEDQIKRLHNYIHLVNRESIEENFIFGIRQLREIAVKALSPGINDPGTANESLKAIFQLFDYYLESNPHRTIFNDNGAPIVSINQIEFDQLFNENIMTIWDYGKSDRSIQYQLNLLITQLHTKNPQTVFKQFLLEMKKVNQ